MENPFRRIYNLRKGRRIMYQTVTTFTSEGADARKWIGRIIMAVILGEAIWSLIVSIMNNLVVPWLGDVMGQASGLPASFTQRPYDYPDLFISVLEFCIAGIVAVMLNYFLQWQRVGRVKPVKSSAPAAPLEPARVFLKPRRPQRRPRPRRRSPHQRQWRSRTRLPHLHLSR